jgi:hypothetical protein
VCVCACVLCVCVCVCVCVCCVCVWATCLVRGQRPSFSRSLVAVEETKGRAFRGAGALQGRGDRGRGHEERGPPKRRACAPCSPLVQSSSQSRRRTAVRTSCRSPFTVGRPCARACGVVRMVVVRARKSVAQCAAGTGKREADKRQCNPASRAE